jgi:hypothetical protein
MKLSSYQLYKEEQKSLKEAHKNKINEWKSKLLNLKNEKDKSNKKSVFGWTNSFS